MLKEEPSYQNLTEEEEALLLMEFEESRGVKKSGTRLSNAAAARDVTAFTKRIEKEVTEFLRDGCKSDILEQLQLLLKRTGAVGFCAIGRSDVADTIRPACVGPPVEALQYFTRIMHTTSDQFALRFDHYTVNRLNAGLELSGQALRTTCTSLIGDGLGRLLWYSFSQYPN